MDVNPNKTTCKKEYDENESFEARAFALNINFNILYNSSREIEPAALNQLKDSVGSPENLISKFLDNDKDYKNGENDKNEAEIKNNNINVLVNV